MTRDETKALFKIIVAYYHDFPVKPERIDAWQDILADTDYATALMNLRRHVKSSPRMPTLYDLIDESQTITINGAAYENAESAEYKGPPIESQIYGLKRYLEDVKSETSEVALRSIEATKLEIKRLERKLKNG